MKLSVFVVGECKAQPRAKSRWVSNVAEKKQYPRTYMPATANKWRYYLTIGLGKLAAQIGHPIPGGCRVDLTFYFERPISHWMTNREYQVIKKGAPVYHTVKPDKDNLEKALLDCAKNAGLIHDDSRVCAGELFKKYATHEPPGVLITVTDELGPMTVGELYDKDLLDLTKHPRRTPGNAIVHAEPGSIGRPSITPTILSVM